MNELRECPFCGGEAEIQEPLYVAPGIVPPCLIRCGRCGAEIMRDTEAEAVAAWNRRAAGWVKCSPETMPKCGERYLVANGPIVKEAYLDGGNEWIDRYDITLRYVTHWRPLPQLPEG